MWLRGGLPWLVGHVPLVGPLRFRCMFWAIVGVGWWAFVPFGGSVWSLGEFTCEAIFGSWVKGGWMRYKGLRVWKDGAIMWRVWHKVWHASKAQSQDKNKQVNQTVWITYGFAMVRREGFAAPRFARRLGPRFARTASAHRALAPLRVRIHGMATNKKASHLWEARCSSGAA